MTQTAGTETEIGDDSDAPAIAGLWAVIPAGGAGTRLWPLSRSSSPKFLHDMTGSGNSLLQATWDRLRPLCGDHIMVVAGVMHEAAVRVQLPGLSPANLVAEPSPRGSMAAIGLAAAILERRESDAVIGSFAADHVIGEPEVFADCVREAVAVARAGYVVRAPLLLDLLAHFHPGLAAALRDIAAEPARLEELWPGLTSVAIDHAV